MTGTPGKAARLDSAIDALLREEPQPRGLSDEPDLLETARLLRDSLPRSHPRFGFTERLSQRLARAGRSLDLPLSSTGDALPGSMVAVALGHGKRARVSPLARQPLRPVEVTAPSVLARRRGLVAGGAIASGVSLAIPIAGAALLRWRRSRSSGGLA